MLFRDPSPSQIKKARLKTYERQLKSMLEEEFLKRRNFHDGYSPWMDEKLLQVGEEGGGRAEMMKTIGVRTVRTFNAWLEANPSFKEAYELAAIYCQAFFEKKLLEGALGKIEKFNPKALEIIMTKRFPDYKVEPAGNKTEVNITNLSGLNNDALEKEIKRMMEKTGYSQLPAIEGDFEVVG